MITQIVAIMIAHIPPDKTPNSRPNHVRAMPTPTTPPIAMIADTLQCVQTPIEHRTATNTPDSSSVRRLN
jgi:hypothetical protein